MRKPLIILLLFCEVAASGQTKTILINNDSFSLKTVVKSTDYTDEPIKKFEIYKDNKKLLTHIISKTGGDSNSEDVELGTYETTDSTITFYSYWARAGDAPISPFGVRKQVYLVNANSNLILKDAKIYIETSRKGWQENKGIKYLFSKPRNETQRNQLLEYIKQAEKEYNAAFIFGSKANLLFKEVRVKLKTQIQAATKNWKAIYSTNTFGYKM